MADPRQTSDVVPGTVQSFFALDSAPDGHNSFRYVDSNGWAIVYPRDFHGVAISTSTDTALGEDEMILTNFMPVPDGPSPVPSDGVLLSITTEWNHVTGHVALGHDSRFPLRIPATFKTHSTGWMQRAAFDFQGNGIGYHATLAAGPNARRADLVALERMVASISFPPAGVTVTR